MTWIAGVDGCRAGWVAAFRETRSGRLDGGVFATFAEVLDSRWRLSLVAVDMPIGLAGSGQRACDREARRLLGPRRSSVFPPPIRAVLHCATYPEANAKSKAIHGKGLIKQAFYLMPKIGEVEAQVLSRGPEMIRECHPELAFMAMNGGVPLAAAKRHPAGARQRRRLLEQRYGDKVQPFSDQLTALPGVKVDDIYDALAVLWTARRMLRGKAQRLPHDRPRDSLGLPMEINF